MSNFFFFFLLKYKNFECKNKLNLVLNIFVIILEYIEFRRHSYIINTIYNILYNITYITVIIFNLNICIHFN